MASARQRLICKTYLNLPPGCCIEPGVDLSFAGLNGRPDQEIFIFVSLISFRDTGRMSFPVSNRGIKPRRPV